MADRVNVDFDLYRIRTGISERGSTIEAGTVVPKIDRRNRVQRYEELDEDLEYTRTYLDRAVTATSQIRTVLETFRARLFTEVLPGRSTVPKTLIFAKDDAHAEEIVTTVRDVFGTGNDFAARIAYTAHDPVGQLQVFRTSPALRIAVTVDMLTTGTDVGPLECVFFMRDVRSAQYYEQMKGRGARTITQTDFQAATPDAAARTRFVIVDATGVTEHDFVEPPLNREKSVSLRKLLDKAAALTLTEDEAATLASRPAELEVELTHEERTELDAVDPDVQVKEPLSSPTMCSSKAVPARPCAGSSWRTSTCTQSSGCRRASSTPRASRPVSCLREDASPREPLDRTAVGIRSAYQPTLHPQAKPATSAPPRRLRCLPFAGKGPRGARRIRALEILQL